jgi:hypothetical protein
LLHIRRLPDLRQEPFGDEGVKGGQWHGEKSYHAMKRDSMTENTALRGKTQHEARKIPWRILAPRALDLDE